MTTRMLPAVAASLLGLAACHSVPPTSLSPARPGALLACESLQQAGPFADTRWLSAERLPAGALHQGDRPLPEHCLLRGLMHERRGADGKTYAIGFEMRLPQAWNGRFFYQGNGGLDGVVAPALGALGGGPLTGALMQGFAVISADAGHDTAQNDSFGLEPQARLDYGYQAAAKLTPLAKAVIAVAYGRGPDRSYIGGCSNGGRHAMVAAARLGNEYDGFLIGAPGYRLPEAAFAQLRGAQQWASLLPDAARHRSATAEELATVLTAQERASLAAAVLARCDALDGARDGLVQDTWGCQARFSLDDLPTCGATRDGQCLGAAQKQVLAAVYAGVRTRQGQMIYSPFPWDTGIAGRDWAQWKFNSPLTRDNVAVGTIFTSPPAAPLQALEADIDTLWPRAAATAGPYGESALSLMSPPDHARPRNIAALGQRGAKLVLYHGVSDPVFSAEDTRQWLLRLQAAAGGKADAFARYFPVPGMNHCRGGPATDQFDLLTPLVAWVEQGIAPQAVPAQARGPGNAGTANPEVPADWAADRSRPLCAYPTVARHTGRGSLDDATQFRCQ
ncbi:MAG: hypothetical protein RL026_88 [Pseudomonadota bacterium]